MDPGVLGHVRACAFHHELQIFPDVFENPILVLLKNYGSTVHHFHWTEMDEI